MALVLICVAQLMVVLDGTIVNIALPHIARDLEISQGNLRWVVTGYALAFGSLLLLGGRLGDLFGRRKVFITGLIIFSIASLLGGVATSEELLLGARGLQGLGAALASPAALALIATTFPAGPARSRAFAVYAAMSGVGAAVGLLLGGWLTGLDSVFGIGVEGWRLTLLINTPIGIATAFLAPRFLAESKSHPGELDLPGAITGTLGLLGLVYGISRAGTDGWSDPLTLVSIVAGSPCWPCSCPSSDASSTRCCRRGSSRTAPAPRVSPRCSSHRGDVRDVLLPRAVHPDRDGLQPAQDRRRVLAVRGRDGVLRRDGFQPGQPGRPSRLGRHRHPARGRWSLRVLPTALRRHRTAQ